LVKIDDVARHAGVAPSTVSYVLSGKRTISEQTRERVMRSVKALGYQPHAGARALASNRSNVIALVIPLRAGMYVPVIMQFAVAVVTAARNFDHDVLLLTQDEGVNGLQRVAGTALVDAIIVMDVELYDQRVPVLRSLKRPSVLIGIPAEPDELTCIDLDFAAAGALCFNHLADLGHRRIALVGSPPEVYKRETAFASRTLSGFKQAAARRRIPVIFHPCEANDVAALTVVSQLLDEHPDVTGIVVHNEAVIRPLTRALATVGGRRVPEDISVVAIGAQDVVGGLTSVAIPAQEIGQTAVQLLMGRLNSNEKYDDEKYTALTMIPPKLSLGTTTARPKR
jgi:DNA-binding LacI/PurR family transcriptional regulator